MTWICVVDDEPEVGEVLREALGRAGHEVRAFVDASDALEAIEQSATPPGAVVVDLVMPHVSGYDVVARLRAEPRTASLPVIVLTGLDLTPEEREALGVLRVIEKPV